MLMAVRVTVVALLIAICVATPGFFSLPNILSLLTTVSFMGCVAVGMTLITISGNIMSFSLGATAGAAAMAFIVAVNFGGVGIASRSARRRRLVSAAQGSRRLGTPTRSLSGSHLALIRCGGDLHQTFVGLFLGQERN
jgi:ribose/xylose/arabinose/galactoside ABC-type transport system permease subunit